MAGSEEYHAPPKPCHRENFTFKIKGTEFNWSHRAVLPHFFGNLHKHLLCQDLLSLIDWVQPMSSGAWEEYHKHGPLPVREVSIRKPEKKQIHRFFKSVEYSELPSVELHEYSSTSREIADVKSNYFFFFLSEFCSCFTNQDWHLNKETEKMQAGAMQIMSSSVLSPLLVWKPSLHLAGKCRGCYSVKQTWINSKSNS